ncbi:MAG: RluA family pseudouridine synthase [Oscillospiraceae bacterium]
MVREFIVSQEREGDTLTVFLRSNGVTGSLIKRLKFLEDGILVDGVRQNTDYRLKQGQIVTLNVYDTQQDITASTVAPQSIPMDIVYMDAGCMVVDKPYYMAIHPSMNYHADTLANAFCGYWKDRNEEKIYRVLNRLDKNTSGLVMIALDRYSAEALKNSVDKVYTAIVQGKVDPQKGAIDAPIGRQTGSIITRCVCETGQYAKTEYSVVKQNEEFSLVDIKLCTGRTHQIRVHFAYVGHPLAGDDLYGGRTDVINRQALHCSQMSFTSQETGKKVVIKSQLPRDMADIVMKI